MFYSLLVLCYIILLQVFIVRPLALSFVKLNYEEDSAKRRNAVTTAVYAGVYLLTLACRIIVKIFYFQVSLYVLLDVLVFFGMFALYSDYYKRDKKYWNLSKKTELIFEIVTVVWFAALTVLLLLFRKDLTKVIYEGQLIPSLIAGAVLIAIIVPLVIFFVKSIKKFKAENPAVDQEELTRRKIREQILYDNAMKEYDARIESGDLSANDEKLNFQADYVQNNKAVAVMKARCFTTVGKIVLMLIALVILGLNFGTSYLSGERYYSVMDARAEKVVAVLEDKGYSVTQAGNEKYDYLTEKEVEYINPQTVTVSKDGEELAKVYFGKLDGVQGSEAYSNELKKFNSIYVEGKGFKMNESRYVAFGRNLSDSRSIYSCFIQDEDETENSISGFFFVESESSQNAFDVFWSIKAKE